MADKTTEPKIVTVQCLDPEDPNPTLYLEPEPTVFVGGKAEMKEVLANILVGDRNNVYKDGDFGKAKPKFKIVK